MITVNITFAALLVFALQAVPAKPAAAEGSILQGVAVQSGGNEPVDGARILLTRANGRLADSLTALADDRGRFSIGNIPPGIYRLFAHHENYVPAEYGQRAIEQPGATITLISGQTLAEIVLPMIPTGVISGRIVDREGEPATRVRVQALRAKITRGQRVMNAVAEAFTNDLGEYRLYELVPGSYLVSAETSGFRRIEGGAYVTSNPPMLDARVSFISITTPLDQLLASGRFIDPSVLDGASYTKLFYPGVVDLSSAIPVEVQPAAEATGVNLAIVAVPAPSRNTFRIRGQAIEGETGRPVSNAYVVLSAAERPFAIGSGLREIQAVNGEFDFDAVTPGRYFIGASQGGLQGELPVEVGTTNLDNLRIVLTPSLSITGRITSAGGAPDFSKIVLQLEERRVRTAQARADGTFSFPNMRPGEYQIALIGAPRNYFLKSMRLGSAEILGGNLRLTSQPPEPLELVLSPDAGTFTALVRDRQDRPAPGVVVVAVPDADRHSRFDLYRTAVTDSSGRVEVEGIVPGAYTVYAWERLEDNAWQIPEMLRPFEGRGKSVEIEEGKRIAIELQSIPPGEGEPRQR